MSTILDLVGSFVIGGLLMMMILRVNINFNQMSIEDRLELSTQECLTGLVEEIEYDFRKMGYGVANPALAVIASDSSSISFFADLDNDGTVETVTYQLGPTSEVSGTNNPRDRVLRRSVNGTSVGGSLGVVAFQMITYDISRTVTADTKLIKSIDYILTAESPFPVDSVYAISSWRGTIRPRNLW